MREEIERARGTEKYREKKEGRTTQEESEMSDRRSDKKKRNYGASKVRRKIDREREGGREKEKKRKKRGKSDTGRE